MRHPVRTRMPSPFGARASSGAPLPLVVGLCALAACGPGDVPSTGVRADSAGVEIVTSDPGGGWTGTLVPVLTMGTVGDGGPTEFFDIQDLEFLDGNTLAVADRGSEEVRVFSLDGTFLHRFGSPGRGPAEFRRLGMVAGSPDSIFTYDGGNDRIGVRDVQGDLVRTFRLEWFGGMVFPVDVTPSGEIVAVTGRHITELRGTGVVVDTSLVSFYDMRGLLIDSVARLPHNERFVKQVGDMRTTVGAPFTTEASLVGFDSGFCYAFGPLPEVRCFDRTGALTRIARVTDEPRVVSPGDIDRYWDELWAEAEGYYREVMLRVRDDLTFPQHLPAISSLVVDDEGRIWARRYPASEADADEWWVFDEGELVGSLTAPAGFEVFDVERELVAGVWKDDLDVEYVGVFRLDYR